MPVPANERTLRVYRALAELSRLPGHPDGWVPRSEIVERVVELSTANDLVSVADSLPDDFPEKLTDANRKQHAPVWNRVVREGAEIVTRKGLDSLGNSIGGKRAVSIERHPNNGSKTKGEPRYRPLPGQGPLVTTTERYDLERADAEMARRRDTGALRQRAQKLINEPKTPADVKSFATEVATFMDALLQR